MTGKWIALLGRCDKPTDAVEDYCKYLSAALSELGVDLHLERVSWDVSGWSVARAELRRKATAWRGRWVLAQYTALAWSSRGFPWRFLNVLKILRKSGALVAVVYHDVEPYAGDRIVDRLRRLAQVRTMRSALLAAHVAVLTVPAEKLSWITPELATKACFIPVGGNLPISSSGGGTTPSDGARTVAVFGVTGGAAGKGELQEIVAAMRFATTRVPKLRLVVLGRGTEGLEAPFRDALKDTNVAVQALGLLPGEDVVRTLRAADVLLFVRGPVSSRRGSALAGIACGLPVIAQAGSETAAPVTAAGVAFYSAEEEDEPGKTLMRVLSDDSFRAALAEKSRRAFAEHFCWNAIATKYVAALSRKA